jgi:hypothetical protein
VNDDTRVVMALAALGLLMIGVVIWLLFQISRRSRPVFEARTPKPVAKAPEKATRKRKRGELVVNGEHFGFDYSNMDEPEVVRLVELIKHSLSLLGETQYADIVASRAKETEGLMKQLRYTARFEAGELDRMIGIFRDYAKEIQGSKG